MEAEVTVEVSRVIIDRINDNGPSPEITSASHAAAQSVDQEVPAQVVTVSAASQCKPGEQHHGNGVRHTAAQP